MQTLQSPWVEGWWFGRHTTLIPCVRGRCGVGQGRCACLLGLYPYHVVMVSTRVQRVGSAFIAIAISTLLTPINLMTLDPARGQNCKSLHFLRHKPVN
eukprot:724858-Rhodomonas_salina.1